MRFREVKGEVQRVKAEVQRSGASAMRIERNMGGKQVPRQTH